MSNSYSVSPTNDKPEKLDSDEVLHADPTANQSPESKGAADERNVKASPVTLGRHVCSDTGLKIAERRHAHVVIHRKEKDKSFEKK